MPSNCCYGDRLYLNKNYQSDFILLVLSMAAFKFDPCLFVFLLLSDWFRRGSGSRRSAAAVRSQKEAAHQRWTAPPRSQILPVLARIHGWRSEYGKRSWDLNVPAPFFCFTVSLSGVFQARRAMWIQTGRWGCWTAPLPTRGHRFVTPGRRVRANRITTGWLVCMRIPSSSGEPQQESKIWVFEKSLFQLPTSKEEYCHLWSLQKC